MSLDRLMATISALMLIALCVFKTSLQEFTRQAVIAFSTLLFVSFRHCLRTVCVLWVCSHRPS